EATLEDRISTAWVRLELGWSRPLRMPQVFVYEVGTNGNREHAIVRIEAGTSKGQMGSLVLHMKDPLFGLPENENGLELALADAGIPFKDSFASLPAYDQPSAVPKWGRPLHIWPADDPPVQPSMLEVWGIVSKLAVGIGELLVTKLERLLYLGPLRTVPPRNYQPPLTE